jgi:hypothetical protein
MAPASAAGWGILQNGPRECPLTPEVAEGVGLPLALWALVAVGEIALAVLLVAGGALGGMAGVPVTRPAGAGTAPIEAAPPRRRRWAGCHPTGSTAS